MTRADARAIIAFCEAEIARRRASEKGVDFALRAFCHALTDVQYAAMEGDWTQVQALMDELDWLPLYRVAALPSMVRRAAA